MWRVEDYSDAIAVLKGCEYSSARTEAHMLPFEQREARRLPTLREFHSSWLMYLDGERHAALREEVLGAIREAPRLESRGVLDELGFALERGRLIDADLERAARRWQRDLVGMSEAQQDEVHARSRNLLDFILRDRVPTGGVAQLEAELDLLGDWFSTSTFTPGRLLDGLVRRGVSHATCLSVLVDSYEPIRSALSSLTLAAIGDATDAPPRALATETLRRHPPFRRINRVDADDPHRVASIDLLAVNQCPEAAAGRHLSFGIGRHSCLGGHATMLLLTDVAAFLIGARQRYVLRGVSGRFETTYGACRAVDVVIEATLR